MHNRMIGMINDRKDQTFDGECHLTNEEADEITAALAQSGDGQEPMAWKTHRYERGMWVETNLHLDEPTATDGLVVIPLCECAAPVTPSKPVADDKPYGWVIPKRGKRRAMVMLADDFDQSSAAAEADIDDLGYFPIYTRPSPPSGEAVEARRLALEEAVFEFTKTFDAGFGTLAASTLRKSIRALTQKDKADE